MCDVTNEQVVQGSLLDSVSILIKSRSMTVRDRVKCSLSSPPSSDSTSSSSFPLLIRRAFRVMYCLCLALFPPPPRGISLSPFGAIRRFDST